MFEVQVLSRAPNFDNLSIEQQLEIVRNSAVLEKWSQKYKDSINCSNPKGFSQKAHCDGKKKNEGRMKQWAMSKYGDEFMKEPLRPTIQYRPGNQVRTMRPKKKYNPDNHRENLINFLMHQRKINRDQAEKQVFAILQKNPDYFKGSRFEVKLLFKDLYGNYRNPDYPFIFDTGAEFSLAPSWIFEHLDLDIHSGEDIELTGIKENEVCKLKAKLVKAIFVFRDAKGQRSNSEYKGWFAVYDENFPSILGLREIFLWDSFICSSYLRINEKIH